jgi:hypothetical protein
VVEKKKDDRTRVTLPDRKTYPHPSELDLIRAEGAAGPTGRRKTPFSKQIKEKFEIPFAFLTEAQWDDIKKASGLRYYVRAEINIALQKYWSERLSDSDAEKLNEKISTAKYNLGEAIPSVNTLLHDKAMFHGMPESYERTFAEQRLDLEMSLEWMVRADNILSDAQKRLSRPPGRQPIYGRLYDLVHRLDFILGEHTFGEIDRSKKVIPGGKSTSLEFVWLVIQAADRHVSKDRVQNVVARYIKDRRRSERKVREWDEHLPASNAADDEGCDS